MAHSDLLRSAQLAGVSRAVDRNQLERLLTPESLMVPPAISMARVIDTDTLGLSWDGSATADQRTNDDGILEAFLRLADEHAPGSFLRFAERYGPLRLCDQHGLPDTHPTYSPPETPDHFPCVCDDFVEIDAWRRCAAELGAALRIAAALHLREPSSGGAESWAIVLNGMAFYPRKHPVEEVGWIGEIGAERFFLGFALDQYVSLSGLRPVIRWDEDQPRPRISLGDGGVYGAVVRHLIFAVAKLEGLAICDGCGEAFTPKRQPARGRRSWCSGCGKKAASRQSMRDRRSSRGPAK